MGERFGHYEIMRRLAAGGMAEVLLAKQTSLGGFERLVCLKRILAHLSGQEEFLRMFMDEARIAANLVHPNVAQIYDIAEEAGQYYIAMEYVRGEDLRRVYNQEVGAGQAIPKHVAALITMGAAAGLDYAHRQANLAGEPLGIVHRDVSPQNILVTYDGHVKLIDFGVAKAAGKLNQTRAGVLKGKYSYMSPEQASGDPLDGRTDIFALGITLYEITTGTRLFKRDNELETLHAVIACSVKPPTEVLANYDADLERIVMRALAYEVDNRYLTAGEMERDLERYLLHRGHPTSASSLAGYMQNLFAEKLADEALFGGPPWNEPATHSRRGPQKGSQSAPSAPQTGNNQVMLADDATVVDPQKEQPEHGTAASSILGNKPVDEPAQNRELTPAEWRELPERPEETSPTRSQSVSGTDDTVVPTAALDLRPTHPTSMPEGASQSDEKAKPAHHLKRRGRLGLWALFTALTLSMGAATWLMRTRAQNRTVPPVTSAAAAQGLGHAAGAPQVREPSAAPSEQHSERVVAPSRGGLLSVEAPVTMDVWLGDQHLGTTPLVDVVIPTGVLLLKLTNQRDGGTVLRTIKLQPRGRHKLVLGQDRGVLEVTAKPWAWVQLGVHPAEETPSHLELFEGDYLITTECPDGLRREQTVRVSKHMPTRIDVVCDGR